MQGLGAAQNLQEDLLFNDRVRTFQEFLDDDVPQKTLFNEKYGDNRYRTQIEKMLSTSQTRVHQ